MHLETRNRGLVLQEETGFFHSFAGNAFQGCTHRRVGGIEARFIRVKAKACPQVHQALVSPTTRWLCSVSLRKKSSLWDRRLTFVPTKPGRAKTQSCHATILASRLQWSSTVSVPIPSARGAVLQPMGCWRDLRPLLNFDYMSLGLGKSRLSFKESGPVLVPLPMQSLSWVFRGSMSLSYPIFARIFPGWTPHFMVAILASTTHASAEMFSPHFILSPVNLGARPAVIPWGDWKACSGITVCLAGDVAVPWSLWSCHFLVNLA